MSIVIYTDYEEFSYTEKEVCEFIEDQNVIKEEDGYYDSDDYDDIFESDDDKIDLRNDASYYIVCDPSEEELGEDIAGYLGKVNKIYLKIFDKIFFYVI